MQSRANSLVFLWSVVQNCNINLSEYLICYNPADTLDILFFLFSIMCDLTCEYSLNMQSQRNVIFYLFLVFVVRLGIVGIGVGYMDSIRQRHDFESCDTRQPSRKGGFVAHAYMSHCTARLCSHEAMPLTVCSPHMNMLNQLGWRELAEFLTVVTFSPL